MTPPTTGDIPEVEERVRAFFAAFVSGPETGARMDRLRALIFPVRSP